MLHCKAVTVTLIYCYDALPFDMKKRESTPEIEAQRAKARERYHANPLKTMWAMRKYRYGFTEKMVMDQLEHQEWKCPVCKRDLHPLHPTRYHIDHCHQTGHVRGILCPTCNHTVSVVEKQRAEGLSAAMAYIDKTTNCGFYSI